MRLIEIQKLERENDILRIKLKVSKIIHAKNK